MQLTDQQKQAVLQKLGQLWTESKACTICGQEKWSLSDRLYHAPEMGAANEGKQSLYPVVILTCSHCGHTLFLNAVTIGFTFSSGGDGESVQ